MPNTRAHYYYLGWIPRKISAHYHTTRYRHRHGESLNWGHAGITNNKQVNTNIQISANWRRFKELPRALCPGAVIECERSDALLSFEQLATVPLQ